MFIILHCVWLITTYFMYLFILYNNWQSYISSHVINILHTNIYHKGLWCIEYIRNSNMMNCNNVRLFMKNIFPLSFYLFLVTKSLRLDAEKQQCSLQMPTEAKSSFRTWLCFIIIRLTEEDWLELWALPTSPVRRLLNLTYSTKHTVPKKMTCHKTPD